MIHKVSQKKSDRGHLGKSLSEPRDADNRGTHLVNYSDVIVKKPWGYEYLIFENDSVAIWMLQIIRKRKTSMHCHPNKKTGLVLLSGNATTYGLEGAIELNPLDGVVVENGVFHATEASSSLPMIPHSENGIWVMEIESPPMKTDLLRLKDEYGRTGASYEGTEHMVFEPRECLKFMIPESKEVFRKTYLDCRFTIRRGGFAAGDLPSPDALVTIIGREPSARSDNPYLRIGELATFKEFYDNTRHEDLGKYTVLIIERGEMVKLSDYIFSFIADLGVKEVFAVCGGGAMHLVDSLGKNERLRYIATHHEQAAAMAAEGHARITGKPGVALVTSGPGGTNTITGVCGAWIDSIPTVFISGQVTSDTLIGDTGLRQFGIQEANITDLVRPVTKYAVTVTDAARIKYHLQKALHLATTGRPGPVWLDIPLDIQSKLINPSVLDSFTPGQEDIKRGEMGKPLRLQVAKCIEMLRKARRPVMISGYGIRLAKGEDEFLRLVERMGIPVVSSWTTSDLVPTSHELYIGRSGIMGDRASNFAVQNSDLLLIIGSRMSVPQVGYNYKTFAREAKKIMVDIDEKELNKPSIKPDLPINADAREFMAEMLSQLEDEKAAFDVGDWVKRCRHWKARYPVSLPEYKEIGEGVNSFYFIDLLSEKLGSDAVIVTDMGTSFTCTMQTFKTKAGQRLFTSSGHASMGFGLPGAIGACLANGGKKTVCISGDGGLQMNLQELQTVVHYNLPIILFVLNNRGYLTIKLMQQNHFGRYVGSDPFSGLSCPDMMKVAAAYGIKAERISNNGELHAGIDGVLAETGPFICEIMMPEDQPLIPRVSSLKKPDGTITAKPLEDLYPFLSREEFLENMIVQPVEILKE